MPNEYRGFGVSLVITIMVTFSLVFYLHILVENLVLLYPLSDLGGYVKFFKVWLSEDLNLVDLFYIVHSLSCHHS